MKQYTIKEQCKTDLMAKKKRKGLFGYFCGQAKVTLAERLRKKEE